MIPLRSVPRIEMLTRIRIVQAEHRHRRRGRLRLPRPPGIQRQVARDRLAEIILRASALRRVPAREGETTPRRVGGTRRPPPSRHPLRRDTRPALRIERHRIHLGRHLHRCRDLCAIRQPACNRERPRARIARRRHRIP